MFVLGPSGCIRAKCLYSGLKLLYLSKSGCNRAKVVVFGQKLLFSWKVVAFGKR